jgi:hypothetical protein
MVPRGLRRALGWRVFLRNQLAGVQKSGLGEEFKAAWDGLKGRWARRFWASHGSVNKIVLRTGRGSPLPTLRRDLEN